MIVYNDASARAPARPEGTAMTNGKHPHPPKAAVKKKPAKDRKPTGKKSAAAKTITKGMK